MDKPAFAGMPIGWAAIAVVAFGSNDPRTVRRTKHLGTHPDPEVRLPIFRIGKRPASTERLLEIYRARREALVINLNESS
jgi:hypothetical protein